MESQDNVSSRGKKRPSTIEKYFQKAVQPKISTFYNVAAPDFQLPSCSKNNRDPVGNTESETLSWTNTATLHVQLPSSSKNNRGTVGNIESETLSSTNVEQSPFCSKNSRDPVENIELESPALSSLTTKPRDNHEFENDIAIYQGKPIDDFTKCRLLETPWKPPKNYKFPFSTHRKAGKEERRFVNNSHMEKYPWLVISPSENGLYCKYCSLFVTGNVGGYQKNVPLQNLVTKPLKSFAKLLGKDGAIEVHNNNSYHRQAMEAATNFLKAYHNPEKEITNQISSQRLKQVEENRQRLKPILENILFLGRQNIPLRGHRDDGNIDLSCETVEGSCINDGNFRELLRFRIKAGDKALEKHLQTSESRATYISKTTQNDLIECIGYEITSKILERVKKNNLYSIMFDETTDVAHVSQLCLVLRYTDEGNVREDFISFTDCYKTLQDLELEDDEDVEPKLSGENLATIVLNNLKELNLDLDSCVGIATDGCSVMVSEVAGAVQAIQKEAKNAIRCPCYSHALNLSISKSSNVQSIRNTVGVMKETISFFKASPKRNIVLKNVLGGQISGMCETRWVERHTAVLQFRAHLEEFVTALETIAKWKELDTASKAKALISALSESEFIVGVMCLIDVLSLTLPLSRYLQKEDVNIDRAVDFVQSTIIALEEKRVKCEEEFVKLFEEASKVADNLGTEMKTPRVTKRQRNRSNPPVNEPISYYRISIYIPLIESVTLDLKSRFPQDTLHVYGLTNLIPRVIFSDEDKIKSLQLQQSISQFSNILEIDAATAKLQIIGEYNMWKNIWKGKNDVPRNAITSFNECDQDVFPLIKRLLHILVVLPASVASAERSFSTLRRLKTWMRSQMREERLVGLALMNIHRDINVDIDRVIDRFARRSQRRLEFVL